MANELTAGEGWTGYYPPLSGAHSSRFTLDCDGASGDGELEKRVADVMLALFDLWKQRQRKYGPENIAAFHEQGCVVRSQDKLARLKRFYFECGVGDMPDETVEDSWLDLANYAIMGLVCHRNQWPGQKQIPRVL